MQPAVSAPPGLGGAPASGPLYMSPSRSILALVNRSAFARGGGDVGDQPGAGPPRTTVRGRWATHVGGRLLWPPVPAKITDFQRGGREPRRPAGGCPRRTVHPGSASRAPARFSPRLPASPRQVCPPRGGRGWRARRAPNRPPLPGGQPLVSSSMPAGLVQQVDHRVACHSAPPRAGLARGGQARRRRGRSHRPGRLSVVGHRQTQVRLPPSSPGWSSRVRWVGVGPSCCAARAPPAPSKHPAPGVGPVGRPGRPCFSAGLLRNQVCRAGGAPRRCDQSTDRGPLWPGGTRAHRVDGHPPGPGVRREYPVARQARGAASRSRPTGPRPPSLNRLLHRRQRHGASPSGARAAGQVAGVQQGDPQAPPRPRAWMRTRPIALWGRDTATRRGRGAGSETPPTTGHPGQGHFPSA